MGVEALPTLVMGSGEEPTQDPPGHGPEGGPPKGG